VPCRNVCCVGISPGGERRGSWESAMPPSNGSWTPIFLQQVRRPASMARPGSKNPDHQQSTGSQDGRPKGLTSIHRRIHCAATHEGEWGNAVSETDRIIVEHFLDTLVEVAMAVAKRVVKERQDSKG